MTKWVCISGRHWHSEKRDAERCQYCKTTETKKEKRITMRARIKEIMKGMKP